MCLFCKGTRTPAGDSRSGTRVSSTRYVRWGSKMAAKDTRAALVVKDTDGGDRSMSHAFFYLYFKMG